MMSKAPVWSETPKPVCSHIKSDVHMTPKSSINLELIACSIYRVCYICLCGPGEFVLRIILNASCAKMQMNTSTMHLIINIPYL